MKQIKNIKFRYHQKKDSELLMIEDRFRYCTNMEYQKITSLLDTASNSVPRFFY